MPEVLYLDGKPAPTNFHEWQDHKFERNIIRQRGIKPNLITDKIRVDKLKKMATRIRTDALAYRTMPVTPNPEEPVQLTMDERIHSKLQSIKPVSL